MNKKYFLREDVYFEPLFNNWYMWPYLLSPATAAMNLANHHLRVMKSFVANAKIHELSAASKAMVGSSLMNLSADSAQTVQKIIDRSTSEHAELIEFSKAVKTLNELLMNQAKGCSMEPLYEQIPEILRGYVELHYDLNNQPSFRFIESLLYRSPFYREEAQAISLGNLQSDQRPFVLSTPRLADQNHLHVSVPLNSTFVSELFKMRDTGAEMSEIERLFAGAELEGGLDFKSLFTEDGGSRHQPVAQGEVRVSYLGHAGIMVESDTVNVLVDPVIAYRNDEHDNKITFRDLPERVDYVLLTHTHMDHVCIETLVQLRHKIKTVLVPKSNSGFLPDPSIKLMLNQLGFEQVIECEDLDKFGFMNGFIQAIPFFGEHADVSIRSKSAWLVSVQGKKILCAADSSNIEPKLFDHLHREIGDVDMLFIGMECKGGPLKWLYGPLLTRTISDEENQSRRFNGSDFTAASAIAEAFGANEVYVYALGLEPWFGYFMGISYNDDDVQIVEAEKLVKHCKAQGITSKKLCGKDVFLLHEMSPELA
ncbi:MULTISPECIES: MBL fold metallo-hydrolase [unclassified Pseudoalteromonas]|uniref:MBL fold metallo-hydrolase n=1 Tax=unclassified Pseudoalteromonas TaxID=194690 RepID=UPI0020980E04|nr:MBL fold metallo-hydrolase [Pseudoalteromonas sp. XMcav2-N]MCO7190795.1 MBL fold metallo-hydrolase [Pseudoalteromonas sp. XMcav2-N]